MSPKQATQQANHHEDTRNTDDEAGAAKNGCCCCCCGGASALAESERTSNGKRENGYVRIGSKGRNKNTRCFKFTARRRYTAGPIYYYSFCIVYKYVVLSSGTKGGPTRSSLDISHTVPISGELRYYIDSSRQFLLNALNNAAEG